ncbi:hypothetical protein V1504DRAFT_445462 [Lipomyces starkeyi]
MLRIIFVTPLCSLQYVEAIYFCRACPRCRYSGHRNRAARGEVIDDYSDRFVGREVGSTLLWSEPCDLWKFRWESTLF